ncbi:MAG: hypothetical protein GX260_00660 [Tissierellia bacterium]|nr:hypothetical protein [Bacillota bacterium]NLL22279.1 hypothetical protein [Tissierellia bacterium]
MISNNFKTIIYHTMWYFLILSVFLLDNMRSIFNGLVPDPMKQILILGIATVIFSTIFAILFLRGQGSFMANFNSMASLVIMDIFLSLGIALGVLFERFDIPTAAIGFLFLLLQLVMVMGVLSTKRRR